MSDLPPEAVRADPSNPATSISREDLLAAVEVSCMVLRPGETLLVRVPPWLHPDQVDEYQRRIDIIARSHRIPNSILILAGEQFAKMASTEPMRFVGGTAPTGPQRVQDSQ